ncbi:hypothetical protein AIG97_24065 [Salmonella enterica subsp. enterica serovar Thompson]|nr:hypothetical protein [Salmonella enterica subsp. enterica]EBV8143528.1 hypothetical protein [Salmonella enterica subsp. enterica serovar Thompson]
MQPSVSKGSAVIVFVDTKWLSVHALKSFGTPIPDECLTKQSEWRLHYCKGDRFNFPQIACRISDSIQFIEGRNRSIVAYETGIKIIPVMAPKEDLGRMSDYISEDPEYFDFSDVKEKFPGIEVYMKKNGVLQTI